MPRYFVSGLCMQGNKGGPALALSLMQMIQVYIPEAKFVFSVPGDEKEWPYEKEWAEKYGVEIVKNIGLRNMVPPFCFNYGRLEQLKKWWSAIRQCDALIQMSAVCYVGPPSGPGTFLSMIGSSRVQDLFMTQLANRPMFAWTQSYGPFSTQFVRTFARFDLKRQKIIFCRGNDCRDEVRKLLPNADARSFPDVAVTLPYDKEWGSTFRHKKFSAEKVVVSLSPSAVLYSRASGEKEENSHVIQLSRITRNLIEKGYSILLVPHTCRPAQPNPKVCDLAVAKIISSIVKNPALKIVEENLSPKELKSIISNSKFHVGARYHSVVAALSSGVPAISMSWHPKYKDLMQNYGMEKYVLDEGMDEELTKALLLSIDENSEELTNELNRRQSEIKDQSLENTRIFCALLERNKNELPSLRLD